MVYVTSVGPVDPDSGLIVGTGVKDQTRQCLKNLKPKLEDAGSSLEKVVWANWALKEPDRVRPLQRGVVALVPGRAAGRPGDADAAGAASRRVPRLARGDRRGVEDGAVAASAKFPSTERWAAPTSMDWAAGDPAATGR